MLRATSTLEEVVRDQDQTLLSGLVVARAIVTAVERGILGQHPVFGLPRWWRGLIDIGKA